MDRTISSELHGEGSHGQEKAEGDFLMGFIGDFALAIRQFSWLLSSLSQQWDISANAQTPEILRILQTSMKITDISKIYWEDTTEDKLHY